MLNGEFNPTWSTDNIWREEDMERCLSNDLNTIKANITNLQTGKADKALSAGTAIYISGWFTSPYV